MNYLFKNKSKFGKNIFLFIFVLFLLFITLSFFGKSFSNLTNKLFIPFIYLGDSINTGISDLWFYVNKRSNLIVENEAQKREIRNLKSQVVNYNLILSENRSLKKILGFKENKRSIILAHVLMTPPVSPHDFLIIDIGSDSGIGIGDFVVFNNIAIGEVSEIYKETSRIKMFSTTNQETMGEIFGEHIVVMGNGGGNFISQVPKDLIIRNEDNIFLTNNFGNFLLGTIKYIKDDPSDYFKQIFSVIPINFSKIDIVQIIKK